MPLCAFPLRIRSLASEEVGKEQGGAFYTAGEENRVRWLLSVIPLYKGAEKEYRRVAREQKGAKSEQGRKQALAGEQSGEA